MKTQFLENANRTLHKIGFQFKKHSPAILVTAGVIGVVASTVMACKATTKLNETLDIDRRDIEDIHADAEAGLLEEKEAKKELTKAYIKAGGKVIKLYAPSVAVGALSVSSIIASHGILSKRNAAISAAYAVVDKGFKDYRKRVKERFGDEVDFELKNNVKTEEVKVTETDEKGKTKEVTKTVKTIDPSSWNYSMYAKCFDESNPYFQKQTNGTALGQHNLAFLKIQQATANDILKRQGYIFLNDVYDMLGFDKVPYGQVIGWVYDEKEPIGDNFVDFGLYDITKESSRNFVNHKEGAIWLDFNVDGNILDLMK